MSERWPSDTPSWSLQDAKNRFSHVVNAARRGAPQMVTRRGRAAVVVLAVEDYERLTRGPSASFASHLLAMPQSATGEGEGEVEIANGVLAPRDVTFER